ncbi:MAG: hypothetical protein KME38_16780 [Spirirestis rafaelensis WJT71-NPBG6]|jgi:hypothetical protein|nr:hypothetical protein [Spirirestis rafaelensis WJT71-NPBG6]
MSNLIKDSLVDSISLGTPSSVSSLKLITQISEPKELLILTSSLNFFSWSDLLYVASGVRDQEGVGIDGTGFRYPTDELDPGEEPLEGVEVYNPLGEVQMSIPAFERLMLRYFRTIMSEAEKHNHPIVEQSWWKEFVVITEKIEQRLLPNT